MPSAKELFGKQVRALRLGKKLSQEKLAEMCAVHRNYIGRVERGDTDIKLSNVVKLSAGLKVRPEALWKLIPRQALPEDS